MAKWATASTFWSKATPNEAGCLLWTGARDSGGYGKVMRDGKNVSAHRWAYRLTHGEIPAGMHVCHRCDVRLCVNPSHLFLGTRAENMADMVAKGRYGANRKRYRGEAHPNAKLTDKQIAEMKALRSTGLSYAAVAANYGVPATTAYQVIRGLRRAG